MASRESDGFFDNKLIGGAVDASDSEQADARCRGTRARCASHRQRLYLDFTGGSTNYSHVTGPTDYSDNVRLNVIGQQSFIYKGGNAKLEFPLNSLNTTVTAIAAYDSRDLRGVSDGDFLSLDIVRSNGTGRRDVYGRAALRHEVLGYVLDLGRPVCQPRGIGCDFGADARAAEPTTTPLPSEPATHTRSSAPACGASRRTGSCRVGVRLDEEDREQESSMTVSSAPGVVLTDPPRTIDSSEVEPRVSLTKF